MVFLGSGIGGVCRWVLGSAVGRWASPLLPGSFANFPVGTFVVNILGCFLIGIFYGLADRHTVSPEIRALLTAGFCGGLTTFSTFSHENLLLFGSGNWGTLASYAVASLAIGFLAAKAGHALVD